MDNGELSTKPTADPFREPDGDVADPLGHTSESETETDERLERRRRRENFVDETILAHNSFYQSNF